MRVVNSSTLWDNRKKPKHHKRRALFGGAVVLGLAIAGVIISTIEWHHPSKPATSLVQQPRVEAAVSNTPELTLASNLSPKQDQLDAALMKKLDPRAQTPPVDCSVVACLALTFDDGPDPVFTPQIMDALGKENVKATFFLIGNRVAGNAAVVQRMYREGFEIGNHSWTHPNFTKIPPEQIDEQITLTQNAITAIGVPAPTLFRPPYGAINDMVRSHIHMPIIRWDVDPKDWDKVDAAGVLATVEAQAKAGGMIILHSTKPATAAAAPQFIHDLKSRFQLVTVTELLNLTPGMQGDFRGR